MVRVTERTHRHLRGRDRCRSGGAVGRLLPAPARARCRATTSSLLDRGPGAGGAWQFRWEALRLGYAHRVNDLPGHGRARPQLRHRRPQRAGARRRRRLLPPLRAALRPAGGAPGGRHAGASRRSTASRCTFDDAYGDQTFSTQVVVNATGTWGSPFVPWYPGHERLRRAATCTPSTTRMPQNFGGQDVVVVGGGTSAIGFLLELENVAGTLTWVTRRPIEFLDEQELNLEGGARAVALQDEAAREGRALPSIVSTHRGAAHPPHPGGHRPRAARREADVRLDRAGRRALGRRHLPARGRDHLGDRVPARAAAPRAAEAAREGGRRHRRAAAPPTATPTCSSRATARRRPRSARTGRAARSRARSWRRSARSATESRRPSVASPQPRAAAPMPSTRFAATDATAARIRPSSASWMVSTLNVLKVVRPPQRPVSTMRRASAPRRRPARARARCRRRASRRR